MEISCTFCTVNDTRWHGAIGDAPEARPRRKGLRNMRTGVLSPAFRHEPYWWQDAPLKEQYNEVYDLPPRAEVVVVGGGYTGLSAALTLARSGHPVLVLDAEVPGFGASTRNHGYIGFAPQTKWCDVVRRFGLETAVGVYRECQNAFEHTIQVILSEQIDCRLQRTGRAYFAYNTRQLKQKADELESLKRYLGHDGYVVSGDAVRQEIGSNQYIGAVILHGTAACHPGLYHSGLLTAARRAGAKVASCTRVMNLEQSGSGFRIETNRGSILASSVILATDGYVRSEPDYFRGRVLPVYGHIIATEALDPVLAKRLFPTERALLDLRHCFHAWRLSPMDNRVLFCGQAGIVPTDPKRLAAKMHRELTAIYPDLTQTPVTHYWHGRMGYATDSLPHIGCHDGVHYALPMSGFGLPMGTYLGHQVAKRVMGDTSSATAFDAMPFRAAPALVRARWVLDAYGRGLQLLGRAERRGTR